MTYTGFNVKKARKRTKVEKLKDEIKKLHQLLGSMIHLHERLKNERIETDKSKNVPALPERTSTDGTPIKSTFTSVQSGKDRGSTNKTNNEGA